RLAVGSGVELLERRPPAGRQVTGQQFVLQRVVAFGLGERNAVRWIVSETHPEAVGLHAVVGLAVLARIPVVYARQQTAGGIAGNDVGRDGGLELVRDGPRRLNAVERLTVLRVRLASDGEGDAGGGHQVALVGGVDE